MIFRLIIFFGLIAIYASHPYSHYGRTCADVVCLRSEECVLRTDPCVGDRPCGRYPTCQTARRPPANDTCSDYRCPPGQYCTMNQVLCKRAPCPPVPTCVSSGSSDKCSNYRCPPGQYCRMTQVQCVRAPCPPLRTCVSSGSSAVGSTSSP